MIAIEIVHWQDVGVFQAGDEARFALEALPTDLIQQVGVDDLDRHIAIHAGLAGAVYGSHTAFAKQFEKCIRTDFIQ
jgi:hypothetical protein